MSNGRSFARVRRQLVAAIREAIADPDGFLAARRDQQNGAPMRERLAAIAAETAELEASVARWDMVYERGGIDVDRYLGHIDRLKAAIAIREQDRQSLQQVVDNEARAAEYLGGLRPALERLDDMTDAELRPIYVALIRELRFYPRQEPEIVWW